MRWENWLVEKKLEAFLMPYSKGSSIRIKDLKIKHKCISLKEENGDYFCLEMEDTFNRTPKAQIHGRKTDGFDY